MREGEVRERKKHGECLRLPQLGMGALHMFTLEASQKAGQQREENIMLAIDWCILTKYFMKTRKKQTRLTCTADNLLTR